MGSPSGGVEYGHYTGRWRPGELREVSGCKRGEREGGGGMEGHGGEEGRDGNGRGRGDRGREKGESEGVKD